MKMSGAKIVLESLKAHGVDTVFGYPGGAVIPLYDELYMGEGITHINTAHEQGASHAADGYARATGKVGVCFATSGPGATNLVTGIATAYMDSVPMIAITGNVPSSLLGKDSFQEVDIVGVTMPITKHNYQVQDPSELTTVIDEAFSVALTGRPGPVLIDITKDALIKSVEYCENIQVDLSVSECTQDLCEIVEIINDSKKPVIFAGGGVVSSCAEAELAEFAQLIHAPVSCSVMGTAAMAYENPLRMGMIGMHGTMASNMAFTKCDLLIVLGARFSDRVTGDRSKFASDAKIIHVDIDEAELDKNIPTYKTVVGDAKTVLKKLNSQIKQQHNESWKETVAKWKEKDVEQMKISHDGRSVMTDISNNTRKATLVATDVGQHQMWTSQYYQFSLGDRFISSGGLGTMGYGLGAAIGAQLGAPDKQVVHITGDGSFRMNLNEMATTVRYNLPIITVVFDNHSLGMVRQWQNLFYEKRFSETTLPGMDFSAIAKGFGYEFAVVTTTEDFEEAFKKALQVKGPSLIQVGIKQDEMVLPMVAPGDSIENIIMTLT